MCDSFVQFPPKRTDQRIEIVVKPGDPDWVKALAEIVRRGRLRFDLRGR